MGIFKTASKLVFGEAPHKRMGMTREQYDQYCTMRKEQDKAFEDEKIIKETLEFIEIVGYKKCPTYFQNMEEVNAIWAMHPEVLSKDGTINPVLEQQTVSKDDSNSLKELELKKQILEMELKLQEMKTQQNK